MKQVSYIILIWNFLVSYHNLHAKWKHPQELLLQSLRISSQVIVSIQNSVSMKDEVTEHTALYYYYGENEINWPIPTPFHFHNSLLLWFFNLFYWPVVLCGSDVGWFFVILSADIQSLRHSLPTVMTTKWNYMYQCCLTVFILCSSCLIHFSSYCPMVVFWFIFAFIMLCITDKNGDNDMQRTVSIWFILTGSQLNMDDFLWFLLIDLQIIVESSLKIVIMFE